MQLHEIQFSINGEINKFLQGSPTIFIRFSGCNLYKTPCKWCDTTNALVRNTKFETSPNSIRNALMSKIKDFKPVIVLTGGEPLAQNCDEMFELLSMIKKHDIVIETNGTVNPKSFQLPNVNIVIDYKPLSSGNNKFMDDSRYYCLRSDDIIKFPFANDEDFELAIKKSKELAKYTNCIKALSPIFGQNHFIYNTNFYAYEAAKKGLYFSVQLHKLINIY